MAALVSLGPISLFVGGGLKFSDKETCVGLVEIRLNNVFLAIVVLSPNGPISHLRFFQACPPSEFVMSPLHAESRCNGSEQFKFS